MKILLSYVLVVSVGLCTIFSTANAQENRVDHTASLPSLTLENDDFSIAFSYTKPVIETMPDSRMRGLQSLIYLAKISEAIDAAINSSFYEKYWKSEVWISSNSDTDKYTYLAGQTINSRYAPLNFEWMTVLRGNPKFSPNAKAFIKLPYLIIKGIGEYRHQRVDGTFAVFR